MFIKIIKDIFGSRNKRVLNKYEVILKKINILEEKYKTLTDVNLKQEYTKLKLDEKKLEIEKLMESYAIVREVAKRTLNMRHFDVQILGGIALFYEKISEISTGEGKTLVATLPACFYSMINKNVHIVTINEYLAKRDTEWMFPIYNFLNISVKTITSNMTTPEKKNAYKSDVVYGTCSEFGFDYLRDNIVINEKEKVQNELYFSIIDEVDSVLIDEARTPLIISMPDKINSILYKKINEIIKIFKQENNLNENEEIIIDEKSKQIHLTEEGFKKIEYLLKNFNIINENEILYEQKNIELLHTIYASLKAYFFFKKDVDYIIQNNEILIIDENTGRLMEGRRWGEGIHQAIEAKEELQIKSENIVLATITYQNFFRLYKKKSGMTGTAVTEAVEFETIYGLEVITIPTNKKCIRKDHQDVIFLNKENKFKAILNDIKKNNEKGRPILVGTPSIEVSEFLSKLLNKINIKHNILNAKNHEKESLIIAEAGNLNSVTIATNMAGRGTDIILGGNINNKNRDIIIELGGLKVIGVERHEARRIDNQLRGRSGRQGDPGETQFYLSLEDDLIRIFMGENTITILKKIKIPENEIISHSFVNKIIENAQKKIENHNFDVRKQLLEYDDIINEQRLVFYNYRNIIMTSKNIEIIIENIILEIIENITETYQKNEDKIIAEIENIFKIKIIDNKIQETIMNIIKKEINLLISESTYLNFILITMLDNKWKDHLINIELLKSGIHLRGYAQKDPKLEYKNESFILFENMFNNIKVDFINYLLNIKMNKILNIENQDLKKNLIYNRENEQQIHEKKLKIGRNEKCFCNSGKKYKYCHGNF